MAEVLGLQDKLYLGNLDARRDWGYAPEFVEAMWLMLQQDDPEDFVISLDERHSVREFAELAFSKMGLDWEQYVVQDERFMRPAEVDLLVGDSAEVRAALDWKPAVDFQDLVCMMVDADLDLRLDRNARRIEHGDPFLRQRG